MKRSHGREIHTAGEKVSLQNPLGNILLPPQAKLNPRITELYRMHEVIPAPALEIFAQIF
ncbi:hypothetical protein SDC9_69735 [bioreactor metagenome]|uniref:Uncharacterized protein n=1 Tax=bioreactor metagenome TaxID=1076179 RepID=A0A644Y4P0_9ZZZZ